MAAIELLGTYTDPRRHFAFATYDQSPVHDGPLGAADILMANLLSLRLGWSDVTPLFASNGNPFAALRVELDAAVVEARGLTSLEDSDDERVRMPALRRANETARAIEPYWPDRPRTWTAVTVSKVLHRLAPSVPIIDSHVKRFYRTSWAGDIRRIMRCDIRENRGWMTELAPQYPVRGEPMPLTRMADILIWTDAWRRRAGQ